MSTPNPVVMENGRHYVPVAGRELPPPFIVFMNVFNTITHLLLGAVACGAFMFANHRSETTTLKQHIYLCVTGYVILMSQAILSLTPFTGWSSNLKYREKKICHWVMQILGSTLAIAGSILRIVNVTNHFETAHGILGILALIFTALSLLGGVCNLFYMKMRINPTIIKIGHSFFGSWTLIFAFLSLLFGFDKSMFRGIFTDLNSNLLIAFTILALIGTLMPACFNVIRRMTK